MTALLAMVLLGAGGWLLRVMFIVILPAERFHPKANEALGHLAPAVLGALVAVEASAAASGDDPAIAAVVVASVLAIGLTAWLTRSLMLAVLVGAASALLIDLVLLA
jgi:branched-subunit amino acid transport protein